MAVAVVLSMALPVMAADNNLKPGGETTVPVTDTSATTGNLTIAKGQNGHKYTIYPVLTAKLVEPDNTYTWEPVKGWSESVPTAETIAAYTTASEVQELAQSLEGSESKPTEGVQRNVEEGTTVSLSLGYYLIVDEGGDGLTKSQPILVAIPQVQGDKWVYDITVIPKSSKTTFEKKIVETDKDGNKTLVDKNTANIGDLVEYRLKADIPKYDKDATKIVFTITDTMSSGLTWDSSYADFAVYTIGAASDDDTVINIADPDKGTKVESGSDTYTAKFPDDNMAGQTFTVTFDTQFVKDHAGEVVIIVFKAKLNSEAIIANGNDGKGNPNNADLEYSNDYYGGTETERIPDDVKTYTFEIDVKKFEKGAVGTLLPGAQFTVYKDKSCVDMYTNDVFKGVLTTGDGEDGTELGKAIAEGVKAGTYFLKETKAPAGYKVYDGVIQVDVIEDANGAYHYDLTMITQDAEGTEQTETENNQSEVAVADEKGTTLPGTGGIGTTIFTFGGLALIVLAGILLVVYTRKQKKAKA